MEAGWSQEPETHQDIDGSEIQPQETLQEIDGSDIDGAENLILSKGFLKLEQDNIKNYCFMQGKQGEKQQPDPCIIDLCESEANV